jgi:hypothetical protein
MATAKLPLRNIVYQTTGIPAKIAKPVKPVIGVQPPAAPPATPEYPAYQDYYSGLLTKLAHMRDLSLAGLQADLQRRTANVQSIVDQSRGPLNQSYSTAIQEAAAVNDAVANRLGSQGTSAVNDLRSQLASLGQDPTAATQNLSKYYSGVGGANYAMDAGDIQRLIGRQAEENTLLNKQPLIASTAMNADYANNEGQIIQDYLQNALDLGGKSVEARSAYDAGKFNYQTDQAKIATDTSQKAQDTYWNNYWNKQNILFKRWQTQIASGDKKAANATKKQIDAAQRQSAIDIANIRAGATTSAAETRAAATKAAAATRAAATTKVAGIRAKKTAATSNINKSRAYQAALKAVIDPKTNHIVRGVNPTGYNSDWTMTRIVHTTLKSFGINPQTPQGKAITNSVLAQASGHHFAQDPTTQYTYDPNWVVKAQKAAAKKNKKQNYNRK